MRMQASGSPDERHCCSRADETQMLAQSIQAESPVAHETEFAFVADNSPSRNLVLPCPKASKVSKMARPSRKAAVIQGRCHSRASSWPPSSWPPSSWPRPNAAAMLRPCSPNSELAAFRLQVRHTGGSQTYRRTSCTKGFYLVCTSE